MEVEVFKKVYVRNFAKGRDEGPMLAICGDMVPVPPSGSHYRRGRIYEKNTNKQRCVLKLTTECNAEVWIVDMMNKTSLELRTTSWMPGEWMTYWSINDTITVKMYDDGTVWVVNSEWQPRILVDKLKG